MGKEVELLTIMVMAKAMRIYRMVATESEPRIAIGRSLLGFLACAQLLPLALTH